VESDCSGTGGTLTWSCTDSCGPRCWTSLRLSPRRS
jgi:hypothetical protein